MNISISVAVGVYVCLNICNVYVRPIKTYVFLHNIRCECIDGAGVCVKMLSEFWVVGAALIQCVMVCFYSISKSYCDGDL